MKIDRWLPYYLLLLLFPVSFLLHNVNENFGLSGVSYVGYLLFLYLLVTVCIATVSKWLLGRFPKAFVLSFLLLTINFGFGAYKDFVHSHSSLPLPGSYKYLLPLLAVLLAATVMYMRRPAKTFTRLSRAMAFFLVINMVVETGWFAYNVATSADLRHSYGDYNHTVIKEALARTPLRRPTVFWIILDEYSNSSTLKKVWGYENPLDSALKARGFFLPAQTHSNYNYTHFSVSSMLDMVYLKGLHNHSIVQLKDRRREEISIYDNNTLNLFEKKGYDIHNYSIFNLKGHHTNGVKAFLSMTRELINFQTFAGRMEHDISWNFRRVFSGGENTTDSTEDARNIRSLDLAYKTMQARSLQDIRETSSHTNPSFFLLHFLLPHEPFMYNPDGKMVFRYGEQDSALYYIPQLAYTNQVALRMADSILAHYRNQDIAIIIQGDHALKFREEDPLFDQESCNILYAVYCSDGDYTGWNRNVTAVNSFRILFNKYFDSRLPLLPDTSFNLYER